MSSILIFEDSEETIELLKKHLKGYQNSFAKTGEEGLSLFQKKSFDIIILDLSLPDMSGFEICNSIKEKSDVPIIILSAKKGAEAHTMAYKLGADNYLEKPFNKAELLALVENKLKLPKSSKEYGNFQIDTQRLVVTIGKKELPLTNKEFKTLSYLFEHFNTLVSRKDLLEHLWPDEEVKPRVVDNHITGLRKKLLKADVEIEGVYGKGYKLVPTKK